MTAWSHGSSQRAAGISCVGAKDVHGSSVQITFHEGRDPAHHAMPPGGFRVAIVNARTLEAGRAARERLRGAIIVDG